MGCHRVSQCCLLLGLHPLKSGDTILLPPFDQLGCLVQPILSPHPLKQRDGCFREGGQTAVAAGECYLHTSQVGSASLSSSFGVWVELGDRDTALPMHLYIKQPLSQTL